MLASPAFLIPGMRARLFVCAPGFFAGAHRRPVACVELWLGLQAGWE